ncbi:hypothetical protein ACFB49_34090 [Sphingomonas sp. DBB INV C78]|uniref:TetR/AcrR family transcriptional regulator n=1 Tax=Sphingomonas sp. DBB INV C78 TaxID=3349434 RepID=UPI0036D410E7
MAEAAVHFLRDGFERTSLDRIAATAKVSKQAIYEYFRGKGDLFEQVVRAELLENFSDGLPLQGDVQATLEQFAILLVESFATPRNYGLFRASIMATRAFPELAAALHDYRRSASRGLSTYLNDLATDGRLQPIEGDPLDLATRLGAMAVEGSRHFLGYPLPTRAQRQAQARLAVEIYLHGWRKADGSQLPDDAPLPSAPPAAAGGVQLRLKPERFAALCTAAADEFLAYGFESASLDRIIATTGVSRSTIYRQFGNKHGLFRHVMECEIHRIAQQPLPMPVAPNLEQRIAILTRTALDRHLEPRSIALHHLLVEEAEAFPEVARAFYATQVRSVADPFVAILATEGVDRPTPAVLRCVHTLVTSGVRYIAAPRPVHSNEREVVSRQAAIIICRGLIPYQFGTTDLK